MDEEGGVMMVDCPCGSGKDIPEGQTLCPACGADLTPLWRLRQLSDEIKKERDNHVVEKDKLKKRASLYGSGMVILLVITLLLSMRVISAIRPPVEVQPAPDPPAPHQSDSAALVTREKEVMEETRIIYTIKAGDTLSEIAKKFYGSGGLWKKIYEANRDKISDPDIIEVDSVIIIPRL